MKVFVTGASGFVGSAVVKELIAKGHQVTGLARSEGSAKSISEAGAEVLMGDLENFDILQKGARKADGVIHTAFIHDFSDYQSKRLKMKKLLKLWEKSSKERISLLLLQEEH